MADLVDIVKLAQNSRSSRAFMANLPGIEKNAVLTNFRDNIIVSKGTLLKANAIDVFNAKKKGLPNAFIERLTLDTSGIDSMVRSIDEIIEQPNPIGKVLSEWKRPSGLNIKKVQTPIGVIAIIYESRPNVTADAAALTFKSGNPSILRCGADSINSCFEIFKLFRQSMAKYNVPDSCVQFINNPARELVEELLKLDNFIDVVIPRGGKDLISVIRSTSQIPVFSHLDGVVHIYVDEHADPVKAFNVILNSKLRRFSICGAVECLLINKNFINNHEADFIPALINEGVEIRGDEYIQEKFGTSSASKSDWGKEYLDKIIACRVVKDVEDAVKHIDQFGSNHTDCIITENDENASHFFSRLDSSIILQNASTQFADGGEFGFGAEIGISTGRLHARGPIGLNELTTFQYHVLGEGATRS